MKTKDNITTSLRYLRRLRFAAAATALGLSLAPLTVTVHAAPIKEAPAPTAHITREFDVDAVTLPYERITVYDDTMYSDETKLTQEGCEGMAKDLYLLVLRDWVETERFPLSRTVVTEPVDEITVVGSIPGSRYDSRGYYIWPTTGVITSGYGRRNISVGSSNHKGLDIGTPIGTSVLAADGGEVIYAQDSGKSGYGNLVKLRHDDGAVTYYAHLSEILVSVGDRVAQGDLIALTGDTGNVTGPHLHFEIRPDGQTPANPASYLEGKPERT